MCEGDRVYRIGMTPENATTHVCNNLITLYSLREAKTLYMTYIFVIFQIFLNNIYAYTYMLLIKILTY